jgi:hypothetical protein
MVVYYIACKVPHRVTGMEARICMFIYYERIE